MIEEALARDTRASYASGFAQLWDDSAAALDCIAHSPIDEFVEHVESASGTVGVRLRNFDLRGAQARLIRLHSPKADVFSAFIYPVCETAAPIYAMEFVMLGGRAIVAVIDLVDLCDQETTRAKSDDLMRHARSHYAHPNSDDVPQWYLDCRSGREMFHRPSTAEAFDPLGAAHLQLLRALSVSFSDSPREWPASRDAVEHANAIAHYKKHHCDNSPGRPILSRLFGEDWTKSFLEERAFA